MYARSAPDIHHNFAVSGGDIAFGGVSLFAVNEPYDFILVPLKGIIVKILGSVKAEVVKKFVISPAVGEIIELYLCCVLSEYLNIYIIYKSTA